MIELTAGFMPLTDSAILLAAKEKGFAEEEGIALELVRENSWANMRDRLAIGHFDIAHALAPMPLAANLGLTPFDTKLIAPMALGSGGNAITVSNSLYEAMSSKAQFSVSDAAAAGGALRLVVEQLKHGAKKTLHFAVVHPHSVHNYELRYWLAGCGIDPDVDIEIVVLPPQLMADALAAGQIDGYCVGEPWNTIAVSRGVGKIATVKAAIWASSPEKVLAMRANWAAENEQTVTCLVRALYKASLWCADKANVSALCRILAKPEYLNQSADIIEPALTGSILNGASLNSGLAFFEPHARAATFPWRSQALWIYSQMVRAGHVAHDSSNKQIVHDSFRPDIYRAALTPLGVAVPAANSKVEGGLLETTAVGVSAQSLFLGPDGFFDGTVFDPDKMDDYIAAQK
ncbi:CmpA/NrtA family ABC transporter substrate-binding protein [Ahrensia kielensis]|uniref:CmpA/NrtA family ABC transporter substrate-binding protein n=1 Tax=Ahrensia kielensis TaxID=76980 RepID=A0ABU9T6A6_9HYPH